MICQDNAQYWAISVRLNLKLDIKVGKQGCYLRFIEAQMYAKIVVIIQLFLSNIVKYQYIQQQNKLGKL